MKYLLALLTLIGLGSFQPASAQKWEPGGQGSPIVCAFNNTPPTISTGLFVYVQCNNQGELITSGGGGGSSASPFLTSGTYLNVPTVNTSVANSALPSGTPPSVGIWNYGANPIAVKLSASGTPVGTVATSDAIIGSGSCQQLATTGFTNINYLGIGGSSSLQVVGATSGAIIGCGGGSTASGGGGSPSNVTPTDCSGTITSGGLAQVAIAAQTSLHGLVIKNIDATHPSGGEPLWFSFTGTAAPGAAGSYSLAAPTPVSFTGGESFSSPTFAGFNHAISIYGGTTSHAFTCTWG